jgi:hypothetical protein
MVVRAAPLQIFAKLTMQNTPLYQRYKPTHILKVTGRYAEGTPH